MSRSEALNAARRVIDAAHDVEGAVSRGADGAEILSACENLKAWLVDVESYAEIPREA